MLSSVWKVVSTLCPVRAVWMHISAEKWSRTSPTTTMSGSWRTMCLRVSSKVKPMEGMMEHMPDAADLVLDRILRGDDAHLGRFR
jgi:hypothetical protein